VKNYFLALQVGQCAQSVFPSAQHFIPQLGPFAQQADLLHAQPLANATTETDRAMILMSFIMIVSLVQTACAIP
jgi:hypothetical protein